MSVCVYSLFVLFCVSVEALEQADHSSKESHRLYNDTKLKAEARAQGGCRASEKKS
jgi:hypothetical protein